MRCPNCGTEIGDESIFCLNCGTKVQFSASSPQPVPDAAVPPVQQSPYLQQEPLGNAQEAPQQKQNDACGASDGLTSGVIYYDEPSQKNPYVTPGTPDGPATCPAQMGRQDELAPIVKMGSWFGTLVLWFLIPLAVGVIAAIVSTVMPPYGIGRILSTILWIVAVLSSLIFMLILAFNKRVNPSKRNFFKAYLLLCLILVAITIVLIIVFAITSASLLHDLPELSYYFYYNF